MNPMSDPRGMVGGMTTTTDQPVVEVPRDGRDRPLIHVEGREKPIAYTRASTFAKALSDSSGLMQWKVRQAVKGLAMSPQLLNPLLSLRAERWGEYLNSELDAVASEAHEMAGANDSARIGTSIHGLTEWVDLGVPYDRSAPDFAPYLAFVDAYVELTKGIEMLEVERFVVNDELQVAGTYDRLCRIPGGMFPHIEQDMVVIGDVKTGKSQAASPHDTTVQIALYNHGQHYNPATHSRVAIHPELNRDWGLLIHIPSNGDTMGLYLLNTKAGWEAAQLAQQVRQWRSSKVLTVLQQRSHSDINHAAATTTEGGLA